ncbi:hypothetical protein D9M71_547180 [compost metagenome]
MRLAARSAIGSMVAMNSSREANRRWPGFRFFFPSTAAATRSYLPEARQSSRASGLPSPAPAAPGAMPATWRSFSLPGSARRRAFSAWRSSRSGCGDSAFASGLSPIWANGLPPLDFTPLICCICRTSTSAMPMPWPSRDSDSDSCWSCMSWYCLLVSLLR